MHKKNLIGYTAGVFDLFHIGHLNILKNAKSVCDKLIVGVSSDELVKKYKNKTPVIPFLERQEIVRSIEYVDSVVQQNTLDKFEIWKKLKFDMMIVGDDWYETKKWKTLDKKFQKHKVKIIYFGYTKTTSSTKINNILNKFRFK
jgi:glycerol-3-phosphate cytidylyltransferase